MSHIIQNLGKLYEPINIYQIQTGTLSIEIFSANKWKYLKTYLIISPTPLLKALFNLATNIR